MCADRCSKMMKINALFDFHFYFKECSYESPGRKPGWRFTARFQYEFFWEIRKIWEKLIKVEKMLGKSMQLNKVQESQENLRESRRNWSWYSHRAAAPKIASYYRRRTVAFRFVWQSASMGSVFVELVYFLYAVTGFPDIAVVDSWSTSWCSSVRLRT